MPFWHAKYRPFIPTDVSGLVAWYDSNSTVLSNDGTTVLSLRDKFIYNNNMISYRGAINSSNVASNLLPNSGSISKNAARNNIVFCNAVMTSTRGILEFQYETTGATVFVCGDFEAQGVNENYVSIFTNNYSNPNSFSNSLTVGTNNNGSIFSNYFVNVYDLSNTTTTFSNISQTPIVVGWFDPNRNIFLSNGFVNTWSNVNPSFPFQNLVTGNNCNGPISDTITVLSNNLWTGPSAEVYGCNAANVLNFPFASGYTTMANNVANDTPQLNSRLSSGNNTSFIRAVAFVVNYSSNILCNNPVNLVNTISATFVNWNNQGAYFRHPYVTNLGNYGSLEYPSIGPADLMFNTTAITPDGSFGGGVWINGSNVWNPDTSTPSGGGGYCNTFDMRSNGFNIVFVRFGQARSTGIAISGTGDLRLSNRDIRGFYGQMGDIIVLGSNYTTRDQENVEGYLAQKYNLLGKLRSGHPFKSGYRGKYPFGYYENSILTGIAFNNCNTVSGFYTAGYFNGQLVSRNSNINILTKNRANFNMFIGDSCNYTARDGFRHNINTSIKEIIVYNNPLSAYDVGRVNQYLQEKNGAPSLYNNGNFTYE